MLTYEGTKLNAIKTIEQALVELTFSNNHEDNKALIGAIREATNLMVWLEDLQIAYENKDLEAMRAAKTNNGF